MTASSHLRQSLGQMVAVLQTERQALAALDLEAIMGAAYEKTALCGRIEQTGADAIDDECRALLEAARQLNEVNRQIRNLIAANVANRLDALTGAPALYRPRSGYALASNRH